MQDETRGFCKYCGRYRLLTKDHFYPRSYMRYLTAHNPDRWEWIVYRNIVMACRNCQQLKGDKHPERWLEVMPVYGRKLVADKIRKLRQPPSDKSLADVRRRFPRERRTTLNRTQKNALRNYDPVMAQHRAMRSHHWRPWAITKGVVYKGERKRSWWRREVICECMVRKIEVWNSLGRLAHRTYFYPDAYRLADLDLSVQEINEQLRMLMFERELASETIGQLEDVRRERKAAE